MRHVRRMQHAMRVREAVIGGGMASDVDDAWYFNGYVHVKGIGYL